MTKKSELNFPGIYMIINILNSKRYVGQATNINERWTNHRRMLRRGVHGITKTNPHTDHLQRAWNKYGENNFRFEVHTRLYESDPVKLDLLLDEQEVVISRLFKDNLYGHMEPGITGMVFSEESRRRLSIHNTAQWKKATHREKISKAQKKAWAAPGRKEQRIAELWGPDSTLRKRQRRRQKRREENPNEKETRKFSTKRSKTYVKLWKQEEYRKKQERSRKSAWENAEIREKRITGMKKAFQKQEVKKKRSDSAKIVFNKPGQKEMFSERFTKLWKDPIKKTNAAIKRKEFYSKEENKLAHKERMRQWWAKRKAEKLSTS